MKDLAFKFYSVLKNEDAVPYVGNDLLAVADGLGGAGSAVHAIDRTKYHDFGRELILSAYGGMTGRSSDFEAYMRGLFPPMVDDVDDTSALWASRIVIARCVYALTEGDFKGMDLGDWEVRARLSEFISKGLYETAKRFDLRVGKYDGQLLLPTTLAFIRYTEKRDSVIAETVWTGDSRCYALTPEGLKVLSVDDEDDSGAITNLFYVGTKKATLNYLRHEIAKPCVLIAASDGAFDPFAPFDHLGAEHTLLSAIKESGSKDELKAALENFYGDIRYDDTTMAFVPFGFSNYAEMQKGFAARTEEISEIRQKQAQLQPALEVMNQSEEEAAHYVLSRTGDRFDYVASLLADAEVGGIADVAVTPEIKKAIESVGKNFGAREKETRRRQKERSLIELYKYVRDNPEQISSVILPAQTVGFSESTLSKAYSDFVKAAAELASQLRVYDDLQSNDCKLEAKKQELHERVAAKIQYYRNQFDALWDDSRGDDAKKEREDLCSIIGVWQRADCALQFRQGLQTVTKLMQTDEGLTRELLEHCQNVRNRVLSVNNQKNKADQLKWPYYRAWDKVYDRLKKDSRLVEMIFGQEIAHRFGLDVSDEDFTATIAKNKREKIVGELKARKEVLIPEIVKALAAACDGTSVIDGQYNATKLEQFRAYYRLKSTDNRELKAFEERLAALEEEYVRLVRYEKSDV